MSDIRLSEKIGSAFYEVARDVFQHGHTHYDESGGRGSLKSSYVSIVVPLLLVQNPNTHALVLRKVANTIRDSFMRSTLRSRKKDESAEDTPLRSQRYTMFKALLRKLLNINHVFLPLSR